jgi:cytochrome c-type biogenesis protein
MEAVFTALSRAVEGAPFMALGAAFAWGLISVLLSPCHLASIPLIVGFMSEQTGLTVGRAFRISLLFSLGVLASIALIGAITAALGQMLGNVGGWVNYLVAAVFFVMGLHLLDVIPLPLGGPAGMPTARRGYLAALVIGFVYGVALGPCTFAYMAPVLAVAFKAGATAPFFAAALFTAFGLGHCAVITGAGTSVRRVQEYLQWSEDSRAMLIGRRVCGVLVIAGGLYFLYTAR